MLMNRGSFNYLTLYFLLGFLLILAPSANLYAQDEDDSVEEIFGAMKKAMKDWMKNLTFRMMKNLKMTWKA